MQRSSGACAAGIQRDPLAGGVHGATAPPVVEGVLSAGAGKPLDGRLRAALEPPFGFDFGHVRVLDDTRGHLSADAIGARAYTVGSDIVFGRGEYAPHTREGMRLLAHELAHVVQQAGRRGETVWRQSGHEPRIHQVQPNETLYSIGRRYGVTPQALMQLNGLQSTLIRPPMQLRIPPAPPQPTAPAGPQAPAATTRPPVAPPVSPHPAQSASPASTGAPSPPTSAPQAQARNWAGAALSPAERQGLAVFLFQDVGVAPGSTAGSVQGARFLLHDTSGASSRATLEHNAGSARGPLGHGANVFVPARGPEILQRPSFFHPRRPTSTEFERGSDLLDEPGRNAGFRAVWAVTSPAEQTSALTRALAGLPITAEEAAAERTAAVQQLNAGSGRVYTTASWAVEHICAQVERVGAAAVAAPGRASDLTTRCDAVRPVLQVRRARAGSTVSVELVQEGVRPGATNENTCDITNPDIIPLPNPPYSDSQYGNTALMYLRAAVMAGRFPEVTTHFVVDAFARGHCDPRCFNLHQFYRTIARVLAPFGHGPGSIYGVVPSYGRTRGSDTVWWHDPTCHGPPPR